MIIGTAGHIDHGKTALVRALTGTDTDRLPEEKRRGITIELGFAPLELPGIGTAGIVDVPGHEGFVRTMLAGTSGIDLALLVIAADEGVMPQTREHVAILSLLEIPRAIVALTKCDLVDAEWLALVREDARALLASTRYADAPLVETSSVSGLGLGSLRETIAAHATTLRPRDTDDLFRMPIDRVFTVRGTGTVVTGTVWSGTLRRDATVRILPGDRVGRVRGIESHGARVDEAHPGMRTAVAIAGVEHTALTRGMVLVADAMGWAATRVARADGLLLPEVDEPLRPRTRVRLHLGTLEVGARVVAAGGALAPGELRPVRLVLDEPIVARAGDRFVLRRASPVATIGGGTITDPLPGTHRPRPWPAAALPALERLRLLVGEAGGAGVDTATLAVRIGIAPAAVGDLLGAGARDVLRIGDRLFALPLRQRVASELTEAIDAYHTANPLEPGLPLQTLRARHGLRAELVEHALRELVEQGGLELEGGLIRRAGWGPRLSPAQEALKQEIAQSLRRAGSEPPSVQELAGERGATFLPILRILEREGVVVAVEGDRYYSADAVAELIARLRREMLPGREYAPAELRDLLGFSRKFLIPFLEFCDRKGVTERRTGGRVLGGM